MYRERERNVFTICLFVYRIKVLACLIEYDLFPEWVTYCDEVQPFEDTHYIKIARVLTGGYPWPISSLVSKREFLTSAIGVSRLGSSERPSMAVLVYDPTDEEKNRLGIPLPDPSIVRSKEGTCVVEAVPLEKNKCRISMVGFVDPVLLTAVPNWMYQIAVKITGRYCFDVSYIDMAPVNWLLFVCLFVCLFLFCECRCSRKRATCPNLSSE